HHLVYALFTSGSTGHPKGVLVEHRGLVDYVTGFLHASGLPPETSYATVTTFAGDVGNTAIFPALCGGGTLHLIAWDRATSSARLAEYFARHRVDVLKAVPSLAAAHLEADVAAAAGDDAGWSTRPAAAVFNARAAELTAGVPPEERRLVAALARARRDAARDAARVDQPAALGLQST
ncbi:MAG TPA: AMP-binding protein, partial [Sorangium sp.]|nr:AMP-binding protein [Sorangium sp.]